MNTKFQIKSLVLGALLGAVAVIGIAADKENAHPPVWEYIVETENFGPAANTDYWWGEALTKRSAEGWEVVSSWRIDDSSVKTILKRPKK